MKLLELFSGTGSVGSAFAARGWDVVSLDLDPKTKAQIHENILTWNYKVFPSGHFDAIWASPCCTRYSCARRGAKTPRNLELADSLVCKSLEIIDFFQPKTWFIENPATGLLKDRPFMQGLPFADADYCCYCDWGYRKRTRIWNNTASENAQTWKGENTKQQRNKVETEARKDFTEAALRKKNCTKSHLICASKFVRLVG